MSFGSQENPSKFLNSTQELVDAIEAGKQTATSSVLKEQIKKLEEIDNTLIEYSEYLIVLGLIDKINAILDSLPEEEPAGELVGVSENNDSRKEILSGAKYPEVKQLKDLVEGIDEFQISTQDLLAKLQEIKQIQNKILTDVISVASESELTFINFVLQDINERIVELKSLLKTKQESEKLSDNDLFFVGLLSLVLSLSEELENEEYDFTDKKEELDRAISLAQSILDEEIQGVLEKDKIRTTYLNPALEIKKKIEIKISDKETKEITSTPEYVALLEVIDVSFDTKSIQSHEDAITSISEKSTLLQALITEDLSITKTNLIHELTKKADNKILEISRSREILAFTISLDELTVLYRSVSTTKENTQITVLDEFREKLNRFQQTFTILKEKNILTTDKQEVFTKVIEKLKDILNKTELLIFSKSENFKKLRDLTVSFSVYTDGTRILEADYKSDKTVAKLKLQELIDAKELLLLEADLSQGQIELRDQLIAVAEKIIATLTKEIEDFLPPIDEVKKWVDRLLLVCGGKVPKKFDDTTFSKTASLSDEVFEYYAKWTEVSTNTVNAKEKKGIPVSAEYKNWIQIITANIQFFNLYFDAQQPEGGINHQLIKEKADGGAFEYGPLRGGVKSVEAITRFFGITREFSKLPEAKRRVGEKEDFTDVIRREGLSYFHGNYKFVEVRNGQYFYSEQSDEMDFFYGGMSRGYDELHQAIMTGKFTRDGKVYQALELKKVGKELKTAKQNANFSKGGVKLGLGLVAKGIHLGLEQSGVLLETIPVNKREMIYKDGKFDNYALDYVFNMLRLTWLDLAFVKARAAGSSIAHGNGFSLGESKVDHMTDLISPAAKILYQANNKPRPPALCRLLMMYKPEVFESKDGTHPGASSLTPMASTERAYDYFQYYLSKYAPEILLGHEYANISPSKLKSKPGARLFFRPMLDTVPKYNPSNDSQRDGVFFHFDFQPTTGTEFDESVTHFEFPDLATAILRGYVDSVKNYYTAAGGFWAMTELMGQDIPKTIDENELRLRIGNVLSSYFGTYKIAKDGVNQDWIRKIYRVHTMELIRAYEENTTTKLVRASLSKTQSAVMELIIPIATATTVKGMVTEKKNPNIKYDRMKMDLILDMYTKESIEKWEAAHGGPIQARNDLWRVITDGARAEHRVYDYVIENKFEVHPRYYKSEREDAKIDYIHHRDEEENPGVKGVALLQRKVQHFLDDWGFSGKLEEPGSYKLREAHAPEVRKDKH